MQSDIRGGASLRRDKQYTVKSGYLVYMLDGSTTAPYALDNETRGLASSILPDPLPIMMPIDFDLEFTVLIILHACMT